MNQAIGESITLAVGVALSPLPIIAIILMLLSKKSGLNSASFLIGWILGIAIVLTAVVALGAAIGLTTSHDAMNGTSTFKIVGGAALLLMGIRRLRKHPAPGEEPTAPKWLQSIEGISPGKALGLGALLAAVNPKNLLLIIGGGLAIGQTSATTTQKIIAGAIFVVLGASTVLVPVVAYAVARQPATKVLESMRGWLTVHADAVVGIVLAIMGVLLVGKGIGGF